MQFEKTTLEFLLWRKGISSVSAAAGSAQWVKDPALSQLWSRFQLLLGFGPCSGNSIGHGSLLEKKKKASKGKEKERKDHSDCKVESFLEWLLNDSMLLGAVFGGE